MKKNIVVGNWKMNLTRNEAISLTGEIIKSSTQIYKTSLILFEFKNIKA